MKCQRKDGYYFEYDVETLDNIRSLLGGYIITPDGYFVSVGNKGLHYPDIQKYLLYYLNDLTVYEVKNWIDFVYKLNQEGMVYTVANLTDGYKGHRLFSFPTEKDIDKMTDACKEATINYIKRVKQYENQDFHILYGSLEDDNYEKDYEEIMELLEQEKNIW